MSDNNKENSILSINGILSSATDENTKRLSSAMPDFKAAAEAEIEKASATAVKEPELKPITEEQEIINEYSGKAKTDPNMSTKRLRELLAAQSGDNSALMEFFSENKVSAYKKVEHIYKVIDGTATDGGATLSVTDAPKAEEGGRLSDEIPEKETFVQESLFETEEEPHEEIPLESGGKATFDEDFASLSDKIIGGEISIDTEPVNDDQITLGVEEETEKELEVGDAESEKDKKLKYLFDMVGGEEPHVNTAENPFAEEKDEEAAPAKKQSSKKKKKKKKKKEEEGA